MPPASNAITRVTEAEMAAMQDCSPTQPTQGTFDPRRGGASSSGPSDVDMADVLCILHPCSPAAFEIVETTAATNPQHVLQHISHSRYDDGLSQADLEDVETFNLTGTDRPQPLDLALRFSSTRKNPAMGFVFGRHPTFSDIVISPDTIKRHSNTHFRIFVNHNGVCMLEDMSTNGTLVDKVLLKGKKQPGSATRMLNSGSIIELVSPKVDEIVKFIVRIPSRQSHHEEFTARFTSYMEGVRLAELHQQAQEHPHAGAAVPNTNPRPTATAELPMLRPPINQNTWGMKWNGGDRYNVVGHLGKGAFATVYHLATKDHGQWYAAKELEKRRFMKNGILDRKLDNELQIMRNIDHPHIVRYFDYHDVEKHLYIIMEYVPCGDLQQLLHARGPLPERLANTVAQQVLTALAYLHKKKITHRDIKPDNILIADDSLETFSVKLSDFGLSKVVNDNSTFLKTFCGTLLYCAPEVFPHWDNYLAAHGKRANKRKNRKAGTPQRPKYHMYSQSVDIWSLGGVLWYAMCLKPPFEGVADATGKGMFDRIMTTSLEPGPLREHGISETAIDLLEQMLDTDPAERPTPEKCLLHEWFQDHTQPADSQMSDDGLESDDDALGTIHEEEESAEDDAPDFSQLSLVDGGVGARKPLQETSLNSSDKESFDAPQSKRFKFDAKLLGKASSQPRGQPEHRFLDATPATRPAATQAATPGALFGEVRPSFLQSSGVFNARDNSHLPRDEAPSDYSSIYVTSTTEHEQLFASAASRVNQRLDGGYADGDEVRDGNVSSLGGVEPDMRELNMDSPGTSADSPPADSNEPQTPKTPENALQASAGHAEETPRAEEATPKEKKYSRRINLPITASFFYDPNDPSTHNVQYASAVSGYDFTNRPVMPSASFDAPPPIAHASKTSHGESNTSETALAEVSGSQFARPAPRLGRLASTAKSFAKINMDLSARVTSWGRATGNTFVYPDEADTRVPKVGIVIHFHAQGIEEAEKSGADWTKLPGLHCLLSTESRLGIKVNGVRLGARDDEGRRLFGRVHTGDVVTICSGANTLEFECLFNHGEGKKRRRSGDGVGFRINRANSA